MGAAVISGLFAVALACLAWMLKNGSRRARLLSRIERYTLVLKDLPEGHPARVHLDAALAADTEQLLALTRRKASTDPQAPDTSADPWLPPPRPPAVEPGPAYTAGARSHVHGRSGSDQEDRDGIDWMGIDQDHRGPSSSPASPVRPPLASPAQHPVSAPATASASAGPNAPSRRRLPSGHASTVLWVLAVLAAAVTVALAVNDL